MLELIVNHARDYPGVTNDQVQRLCGVDRNAARRLLLKLLGEKKLRLVGRGRGARYEPV